MTTYIDDDTSAFGNTLLTISLANPEDVEDISKVEVHVGHLTKTYPRPTFPLKVNLSKHETSKIFGKVLVRMTAYDKKNKGSMCSGYAYINIEDWKLGKI